MAKVVDTPYFVDSRFTTGIQLADLVAGVIRQYEEAELFGKPPSDAYQSAIVRYYGIIAAKTGDMLDPTGRFSWHGLHRMPERLHYFEEEEEAVEEGAQ